jgi:hypothetical protein
MTIQAAKKKTNKRGPKKKEGVRKRYDIRLYLWEGEDDDLIAFLDGLPSRQRPSGLKLALRSGGALANLQSTDLEEDEGDMDFDLDDFLD